MFSDIIRVQAVPCGGCAPSLYECKDHSVCVDQNLLCDGVDHCRDGSDEMFCKRCTLPRSYNYYKLFLNNTVCLANDLICDGINHIPGGGGG